MKFIFTCEHGSNKIPTAYKKLFKQHTDLLNTHRGYDIGILEVFKFFAKYFNASTYYSETSRLLIELNRSPHHRNLFSPVTKSLDQYTKEKIITDFYLPYRNEVTDKIESSLKHNQKVVHISFHSFTPFFNNKERNVDIGLLYDPKSGFEKELSRNWKQEILSLQSNIEVRFNYPYLGIADGLTSYLRKKFGYNNYCGIELEVNQKLLQSKNDQRAIQKLLVNSFHKMS